MGLSNGFVWKVRGKAVSAQWCEELAAILGVSCTTGGPGADLWIEQGKFRAGQPFDPSTLLELSSHAVASPRRSHVRAWSGLVLLRHEELAYVIAGLGEVSDREGRIDQMRLAMLPFYEAVAARGGLPLHAALAEIGGQGVILAGVSGAGKSTCSRRFPAPWRILSDDLAVVVPCEDGTLRAHPLPTWSAVKAQTVERPCVLRQSVPVRAIFFLVHSDAESAVPVGAGRAALSIYDAAMQVFMSVDFAAGIPGGSTYMRKLFENAAEMAAAVPSFVLRVSLQGRFWECVERALDQVSGAVCGGRTGESRHSTRLSGEGRSGIDQRHIA
jgi:SynChlorMet cassette protein ScmC